ncbi:hypothetical protein FGG08_005560 [Glutinoglossum americanum]|uniref:Uncharacterized protein n=1 Tax=Glutinoglossum americanum TaxID=1670608 RepID=A0A9P8L1A6_9PEZI|nr:hypothetical protein FGG08_005560 [Glutinoglossum americanum]
MSGSDSHRESSPGLQLYRRAFGESSSSAQAQRVDSSATTIAPRTSTSLSKSQPDTTETGDGVAASDSPAPTTPHEDLTAGQGNDQPQSQSTAATTRQSQSGPRGVLGWLYVNSIAILFGLPSVVLMIVFGLYTIYSWRISQRSYAQDARSLELSLLSFCMDHIVESRPFSLLAVLFSAVERRTDGFWVMIHTLTLKVGESMDKKYDEFLTVMHVCGPFVTTILYLLIFLISLPNPVSSAITSLVRQAQGQLARLLKYSSISSLYVYIPLLAIGTFYIFIMLSISPLRKGILWLLMGLRSWSLGEANNARGVCFIAVFTATIFLNWISLSLFGSPFLSYVFHNIVDYYFWTTISKRQSGFRRGLMIDRAQPILDLWMCRVIAQFSYANLAISNYTLLSTVSTLATSCLTAHYEVCDLQCGYFDCSDHEILLELFVFTHEVGKLWLISKFDRPLDLIMALVIISMYSLLVGFRVSRGQQKQREQEDERRKWENEQ